MECMKCKGTMRLERFSDFFVVFYAWKCFNCGAMIDRTIRQQPPNEFGGTRGSDRCSRLNRYIVSLGSRLENEG